MTDFRFDEQTHTYWLGEERLPGPSELFKHFGLVDTQWYAPGSAQRGKAIHAAIAIYCRGELEKYEIDPVCLPYMEAWKKFVADTGYKSDVCETPMYNPIYRFACIPDDFGQMDGDTWVIDRKTGASHWTARLQLTAQALCAQTFYKDEQLIPKRATLEIKADGTYKLRQFSDENWQTDRNDFLSLVTTWHLQNRRKQ